MRGVTNKINLGGSGVLSNSSLFIRVFEEQNSVTSKDLGGWGTGGGFTPGKNDKIVVLKEGEKTGQVTRQELQ